MQVGQSAKKLFTKWWKGERFNGLMRTQHLVTALTKFGPMTSAQLWEKVQDVSGIASKRSMKKLLQFLHRQRRVKTFLNTQVRSTSYYYRLTNHKKNVFEMPENYPEGLEKIPRPWRPPTPTKSLKKPVDFFSKENFPEVFPEARVPKQRWQPPPPPEGWVEPPKKKTDPRFWNPIKPFIPNQNAAPKK